MSPTQVPTAEALTLSASLFHADVDAWLPQGFGVERSEGAKDAEWAAARTFGAGGERLGLGHPHLADPDARRAAVAKRAGTDALRKALKRKPASDDAEVTVTADASARAAAQSDSDEEESRTRAVGKKRRRTHDAFGNKAGGAAKVHPLLDLRNPIPGYDAPAAPAKAAAAAAVPRPAVLGDEVNPAAALAASLSSGAGVGAGAGGSGMRVSVARRPSGTSTDGPMVPAAHAADGDPPMSKADRKREKKKRQKAKKAAAAVAAS